MNKPAEPSPEVAPMQRDPKCHLCGGAGAVDSGGNEPWGAQIWIKCGYCGGTGFENPLGPEDLAELDRLMETHPRLWLHIRTVGQVLGLVQEELAGMKDARPYTVKGPESPKCPHCGLNEFMHFGFESPCPTPVPAVAPRETQGELRTRIKQLRYAAERAISQGKDEVQIDAMELLQFVERLERSR